MTARAPASGRTHDMPTESRHTVLVLVSTLISVIDSYRDVVPICCGRYILKLACDRRGPSVIRSRKRFLPQTVLKPARSIHVGHITGIVIGPNKEIKKWG